MTSSCVGRLSPELSRVGGRVAARQPAGHDAATVGAGSAVGGSGAVGDGTKRRRRVLPAQSRPPSARSGPRSGGTAPSPTRRGRGGTSPARGSAPHTAGPRRSGCTGLTAVGAAAAAARRAGRGPPAGRAGRGPPAGRARRGDRGRGVGGARRAVSGGDETRGRRRVLPAQSRPPSARSGPRSGGTAPSPTRRGQGGPSAAMGSTPHTTGPRRSGCTGLRAVGGVAGAARRWREHRRRGCAPEAALRHRPGAANRRDALRTRATGNRDSPPPTFGRLSREPRRVSPRPDPRGQLGE